MTMFLAILSALIVVGVGAVLVLVSFAFDRQIRRLKGEVARLAGQLKRLKQRFDRNP
jgi:hypothetical protein